MRRLAVAGTALLATLGVAVVLGYLLVFSASADRTARAVPADTALYLSVYLRPSSEQRRTLDALIERVPGFADPDSLDLKLHQLAQSLLSGYGLDYQSDLRPWVGDEVALAASFSSGIGAPQVLLLMTSKDTAVATASVARLMASRGGPFTAEPYRGVDVMNGSGASYVVLPDLVIIGPSAAAIRAAVDADANRAPSLADSSDFRAAMGRVRPDHLAAAYADLRRLAQPGVTEGAGGYSSAALTLVAAGQTLQAVGFAPFDASRATEAQRGAFALGAEASNLAGWMPPDAHGEMVVFGLQGALASLESGLRSDPSQTDTVQAINSLRALAALGLGVNIDRDLLPLFDRESALVLDRVSTATPHGTLLLRPADAAAARAALGRIDAGLTAHGARITTRDEGGVAISTAEIPQIGIIAYAMSEGVVIIGSDADAIAADLRAHATGNSLARTEAFQQPFVVAGGRGGTEVWLSSAGLIELAGEIFDLGSDARDILTQIGAVGMTAPSHDNRLEIHAVVTVR